MERQFGLRKKVRGYLSKSLRSWGLFLCLLMFQELAMAQPIDRQYWVNIHTQGAAWTLRINDLYVQAHRTTEQYSISYPISVNLKEGANTVSFIYAPLLEDEAGNLLQDAETGELMQGSYVAATLRYGDGRVDRFPQKPCQRYRRDDTSERTLAYSRGVSSELSSAIAKRQRSIARSRAGRYEFPFAGYHSRFSLGE